MCEEGIAESGEKRDVRIEVCGEGCGTWKGCSENDVRRGVCKRGVRRVVCVEGCVERGVWKGVCGEGCMEGCVERGMWGGVWGGVM